MLGSWKIQGKGKILLRKIILLFLETKKRDRKKKYYEKFLNIFLNEMKIWKYVHLSTILIFFSIFFSNYFFQCL